MHNIEFPDASRILSVGSALFLAAVMLFAGGDKLFHYGGFVKALESYVLVPNGSEAFLALPLILAELILALGLLLPAWRRRAAVGTAALLAIFTVAVLVNQRLVPEAPCGCTFTLTLGAGDGLHIALNLLLVAVAVSLAFDTTQPSRSRTGIPPEPDYHQ